MKAKLKVIPYGDKLMILQNDAMSDYISIHSVKDCKKELAKQEITDCTETKRIDKAWKDKFLTLWEKTGKVEKRLDQFDLAGWN